jgi:hypothetical protein
MTTINLLR